MHFRIILFFINILFSLNVLSLESVGKIDLTVNSYNFSQAKYIEDYIGDFSGPVKMGNHAVSLNKFMLDIHYGDFNIGVFRRLEHQHYFTSDTIRLQHNIKNNLHPNSSESYQLRLKIDHFDATGIKLGYQWQHYKNISVSLIGNYFSGVNFHSGELAGIAEWNLKDDLIINAPSKVYSAKNILIEFPRINSNGTGFSVDLGLNWKLNDQWNIQLSANDIASEINWNKALLNKINRWDIYEANSSGVLETSPVLEGNVLTYKQELIKNYKGSITFKHGDHYEFFSTLFQNKIFSHHHLGVQKNIDDNQSIRLAWHTNLNSLEIGYKTKLTTLKLVTDSLPSKKRHALSFSAGISYLF